MKKIIWNKDTLIILSLMIYLAVMDSLLKVVAGVDLFVSYSLTFNLFFIGLMGIVCALFRTKGKYIFTLIVGLIMAVYCFAQAMHFQVFNTFFSLAKITMLPQLMAVGNGAVSSIDIVSLQMLFPFIVLVIVTSFTYFKIKNQSKNHNRKSLMISLVMMIMMCVGCGFTIQSYPDYPQHVRSYEYLYERLYNKTLSVKYFGIYSFLGKDIYNTFIKQNKDELANIEQYQQYNGYQHSDNEYTGMFEGKNLILILAESVSAYSINETFTPFIYELSQKGITFNQHYAPLFDSNTADSELIALTGTMPSTEGSITPNHYFANHYNTALPHLFNQQGYTSLSFHSWYKEFYNRYITHPSYGFTHYYADDILQFNKFKGWRSAINWPNDTELFKQVLPLTNTEQPFFDFIISAGSHMPYRKDRQELKEEIVWLENNGYQNSNSEVFVYNASLHNLDTAVKELVESLEAQGLMEDTVIAIFGDHYPYGLSDKGQQAYFKEIYNTVDMYQTPFIIYAKDIEPITINAKTSTFDIYPTLANLFNLDIDGQIVFGSDALDPNFEPLIYFPDYSWMNQHAYFNASQGEVIYYDDILTQEDVDKISDQVIEDLMVGQDLLASDSFTYKDGKIIRN